ncbi:hypothetical protein BO443_80280 [Burkholderia orbicola]
MKRAAAIGPRPSLLRFACKKLESGPALRLIVVNFPGGNLPLRLQHIEAGQKLTSQSFMAIFRPNFLPWQISR